jgi:quinol monooxygenase YgiN
VISKTARFAVRRQDLDVAADAVRTFVAYLSENEPGTRLYATFTRGDDPVEFLHLMVFRDEVAESTHRESAAVRRFTDILYPVTADGVRFDDFELLATTPLRG